MSSNFADGLNMTMVQLQQENRRLANELATTIAAHATVVPRATFDQEKAEHDATKIHLVNMTQERDRLIAKVARGIEHNKGRDWDDPVPERQSWIDFWEGEGHSMECIEEVYRMCCAENNINTGRKKQSPHALRYVEKDQVRRPAELLVDPEENFEMNQHFDFKRLIKELPEVACKIAIMTMKKGSIIHFIARLDRTEAYPPQKGGLCRIAKVPMRFWWGPGKCVHINSAHTIGETLAPLHACRDFLEIFGNAFWSQNKFSFASFGELQIFRRNIRQSYIERIVNIEIWWQGGRNMLPVGCNPKTVDRYDRRTWPLSILTWMKRLKSIEIYVDESTKMRRPTEPDFVRKRLEHATRGQDNNRLFRDLRKLHGTDFVCQLQGMKRVRVFDAMHEEKRHGVVDDSFVRDMRAQTTQAKSRLRSRETQLSHLKPMLRRNAESPAYERSIQVDWIWRSMFDGRLRWDDWRARHAPQQGGAGGNGGGGGGNGGGGGGGGGGGYDALGDGNGVGEGNPGNPGNGGDAPQNRDNDSDSDSSDDSGAEPDSLFVRQPGLSRIQAQPGRFTGRRNMARDANGALDHGFGEGAIEIDSDDDDDDDDDVIVDEGRSAPACSRGMQIDLTNIPDDESAQVKEEDKDMDAGDAPAPNPAPDANPATDLNGMKPDDGTAPAPQPENAAGDDAQSQEPKPDGDTNMPDIYSASPGLEDGAAAPLEPNMMSQMPQGNEGQAKDVQVPDAEMADPADETAASLAIAESPIPNAAENPIPSIERPEQPPVIDLDDYSYDDDVEFIEARFEPIKIEDDDDDYLQEMQEVIAESCRRSNNGSAAPTDGPDADVKVKESAPASVQVTQSTPNVMREAANVRRSLTPAAGR